MWDASSETAAVAWADRFVRRTGPAVSVRVRPWAAVLRLPTSAGDVFLKAGAADTRFEAGLYGLVSRVAPEFVLTPLAVDVDRGWMLLPDGGAPLGQDCSGDALTAAMVGALPRYAELQRRLMAHVDDLLALGVVDMRPAIAPQRFDEAVAALGDPSLAGLRPRLVEWAAELADSPIGASLDHNDLHHFNVLRDGRFYDWGDAVVAHPFATMLALGYIRGADPIRMRDAYLEPFTDLAPRAALVHDLELACRVGKVARTLVWIRALAGDPTSRHADAPRQWLASLATDSWLGPGT